MLMALHYHMIFRLCALQTLLRRVIRQCGFVSAEPQLAITAPPEHQRLFDHNLLALTVSQIEVAHRDGDVAVWAAFTSSSVIGPYFDWPARWLPMSFLRFVSARLPILNEPKQAEPKQASQPLFNRFFGPVLPFSYTKFLGRFVQLRSGRSSMK